MSEESVVSNKQWLGFAVAILMSRTTGDHLTGQMWWVLPYEIAKILGPFIGYGITGVLLGLCMFYFLGPRAKSLIRWLPLLLLSVVLFGAFLNLFSAGRAGDWSVFGIIGLLLSRVSGYAYLLFLPLVSAVVIYLLETRKLGGRLGHREFGIWLFRTLRE
jgi:hypothetical protein